MGIRGSSTCPLILTDCKVPVENLLGEVGKGHHIAFNILNIGPLQAGCRAAWAAARNALQNAISTPKSARRSANPSAEFGLIQEKLAEWPSGIYAGESLVYRTIGMIDARPGGPDTSSAEPPGEIQKRIEEYAVECSILKVWGSGDAGRGGGPHRCRSSADTASWRSTRPSAPTATRA